MSFGMHRITHWVDQEGNVLQVAVACLDTDWECHVEAVEHVGPFESLSEATERATAIAHSVGGYHAHQGSLPLSG